MVKTSLQIIAFYNRFVVIQPLPAILLVMVLLFSSCKKYEEEVVPDNTAPPDSTVDEVTIENYVNKVYISVLGREPDSSEKSFGVNLLRTENISMDSRSRFLDSVFVNPEFKDKFYERARLDLLQGLDTAMIAQYIGIFQLLLSDSSNILLWSQYQMEMDRLIEMREIPDSLAANQISYIEVHRRCVNNLFYDQINMGSFNLVVSMFQNFLNRYPTNNEQTAGVNMVNGASAILFLKAGQSKNDFITIFFSSEDYYEGQVRGLYSQYLFREPNTLEMSNGTLLYMSTDDYIQLQKSILSTDEYIGI